MLFLQGQPFSYGFVCLHYTLDHNVLLNPGIEISHSKFLEVTNLSGYTKFKHYL